MHLSVCVTLNTKPAARQVLIIRSQLSYHGDSARRRSLRLSRSFKVIDISTNQCDFLLNNTITYIFSSRFTIIAHWSNYRTMECLSLAHLFSLDLTFANVAFRYLETRVWFTSEHRTDGRQIEWSLAITRSIITALYTRTKIMQISVHIKYLIVTSSLMKTV